MHHDRKPNASYNDLPATKDKSNGKQEKGMGPWGLTEGPGSNHARGLHTGD